MVLEDDELNEVLRLRSSRTSRVAELHVSVNKKKVYQSIYDIWKKNILSKVFFCGRRTRQTRLAVGGARGLTASLCSRGKRLAGWLAGGRSRRARAMGVLPRGGARPCRRKPARWGAEGGVNCPRLAAWHPRKLKNPFLASSSSQFSSVSVCVDFCLIKLSTLNCNTSTGVQYSYL